MSQCYCFSTALSCLLWAPACPSTIQVPDILSHSLGGTGGGGRHRRGNTEVPFSVNSSCIDLTHPSFLEFLEHLQLFLINILLYPNIFPTSFPLSYTQPPLCHQPQQTAWAYTLAWILSGHSHSITEPFSITKPMFSTRRTFFITNRLLEKGSQFSAGSYCVIA